MKLMLSAKITKTNFKGPGIPILSEIWELTDVMSFRTKLGQN